MEKKAFICKVCKAEFSHQSSHSHHSISCGKKKELSCQNCSKCCKSKDALVIYNNGSTNSMMKNVLQKL